MMRMTLVFLICLVLIFPACTTTLTPDVSNDGGIAYGEFAIVHSVNVLILESFPVQVRAVVKGDMPDGCTEMFEITATRNNDFYTIKITSSRPITAVCTDALVPFEETVILDVLDLPAGTYTVDAYGKTTSFTLSLPDSIRKDADDQPAPSPTTEPPEGAESKPVTPTRAETPTPTLTPASVAHYRLVFHATWSVDTHPADFPPNPHFSGLIGAVHQPTFIIWDEGMPASPGMKRMAELGAKSPLDDEIQDLVVRGGACEFISGDGVRMSPGTVEVTFTANQVCHAVSIVTMIAPSPDWFVGVSALNLLQDGAWVDELVVELSPWDSGTDSGVSYASGNEKTTPPEVIKLIDTYPLLIDGKVPSLGTFTFTRLD